MTLKLKLILMISFLFFTAIGNSFFIFQFKSNEKSKLYWINHTHDVINYSERFFSSIKDAETGQRGYLLTQDANYLQPYYNALESSKIYLRKIAALTNDREQQQKLEKIEQLVDLKFKELAETITLTQQGDIDSALAIVKEDKGKQFMDSMRQLVQAYLNVEALSLEQRKGDYKASQATMDTLIIVQLILFSFLALLTFLFLNKNLFLPLDILLSSTKKTEQGKPLEVADLLPHNELGYLMSRFYEMNEIVNHRAEKLEYKALHDPLTGLQNRTRLIENIELSIKNVRKNNNKSALFFIDLDDFKQLNDNLGHEAGDTILKVVAKRLKAATRNNDHIFRIGGDEFVLLVNDLHYTDEVEHIINKLIKAISTEINLLERQFIPKLSIGIALIPDHSDDSVNLLKYADVAMYAAKKQSGTKAVIFSKEMLKRSSDLR